VTISPGPAPDGTPAVGEAKVERELLGFLAARTGAPVSADLDLFASGTISSLFAMELVVHLEQAYGVVIAGSDLRRDNFRTVEAMTALVVRLRMVTVADSDS
jgi:methoxymalonate biosynthesis acyl carrier protein